MLLADAEVDLVGHHLLPSVVIFLGLFVAVVLGARPLVGALAAREAYYDRTLRRGLLLDINPRAASIVGLGILGLLALMGYAATGSLMGLAIGGAIGAVVPWAVLRFLRRRRVKKLESQLVGGIQTLASGVRAGLNLVQSMELVSRDGPAPLRQEFAHLLREYEYGMSLDEAMRNAANRIGSGDFRLLFAALLTHRERGGDLGETLDRMAESIREIQRLESRVDALTAQGRATARALGLMPIVVLLIIYFMIDSSGVKMLFTDDIGKLLLLAIILLTVMGFLWIRKIVAIDI